MHGFRPERRDAAQKDVQDHACAPNVRFRAVVPVENLGRDVERAAHDFGKDVARFEEAGGAEVRQFQHRILVHCLEQEILGLQVAVHDAGAMARIHDADDGAREMRGLGLRVGAALDDAVEQLAALAELHHKVDGCGVLVRALDGDHVGVACEVVHDLDLAPHILDLLLGDELPLGDALARVLESRCVFGAQVRDPELAFSQFSPECVEVGEILALVVEHCEIRCLVECIPASHLGHSQREARKRPI